MKKQLQVWKLIAKCLQQNIPVMLLYVLESFGSSPGRTGFAMAVNALGETEGSIGGGIMEHKFVEMAKEKLKVQPEECTIYKQVHDKSSTHNQSGMICSGEQSNLVYTVRPADVIFINEIVNCYERNQTGKLTLSKHGIKFDPEPPGEDFKYEYHGEEDEDWLYEEKMGYRNHLHIIGAGHCALALSQMMSLMDFYIHLYDDRNELKTFDLNRFAHAKVIVDSYSELKNFAIDESDYVVVMTVGYRTDDLAIRTLINLNFKYFGVLGSKKKIEKLFGTYRAEGIDESRFNRIHAPVGIAIHSQTPEEIAVSIAAQIIQVKNQPG